MRKFLMNRMNKNEEDATTAFLTQLSSWDSEEMSEQLQQES